MRKWAMAVAILAAAGLLLAGRSMSSFTDSEGKDLDFTVVTKSEMPDEITAVLEEQIGSEFQTACQYGEYLYLICGYKQQDTTGYSVQVKKLCATDEAIYFQSELIGPEGDELVAEGETIPWIVVKTEYLDLPVIFES